MTILPLAWKSAWSRRFALALTVGSIMLSVAMLLTVERVRHGAHDSFAESLSGTDLIVGPRGDPLQLLLYAVFHVGDPVEGGMSWHSAERIAADPAVAWTVPISLGDSHRGFPVVATTPSYFDHYRYGHARQLRLTVGSRFDRLFDVVLGADVARELGYTVGDKLTLSHGASGIDHHHHDGDLDHHDMPFTVIGILAPTGTPVDRTLHVGLQAMQAIHLDWQGGARLPGTSITAKDVRKFDLRPWHVTALLVGLKQRAAVLRIKQRVDTDPREPLTAAIPGVALEQLWDITGGVERVLRLLSVIVLAVSLAGLAATIVAGLNERRRELAVLRAVGARPRDIFLLLIYEGLGLTLAGGCAGLALVQAISLCLGPWLLARWGVALDVAWPGTGELILLALVAAAGLAASTVPGWRAYRLSLADGLTSRT